MPQRRPGFYRSFYNMAGRLVTSPAAQTAAALAAWSPAAARMPTGSRKRRKINGNGKTPMPRRRNYKRRSKRRGRIGRGRRRKRMGTERYMRKGGRKLKLMTHIIPMETFVKLPFSTTPTITKAATSTMFNHWPISIRNSLYWPADFDGTRLQRMVRGADAWASFYRQYEILGFKVKFSWTRDIDAGLLRLYLVTHSGTEDRSSKEGNAIMNSFRTQKNTRVQGPIYALTNAKTNGLRNKVFTSKYISVRRFARSAENRASFTALTGLPGTAGASSTDPGFGVFFNIGVASDSVQLTDIATAWGFMDIKVIYYVRFFDRKYFTQDVDGDADQGPAAPQTTAPLNTV